MLIRKLDPEKFIQAYGIDIQLLYPWEGMVETPFGAAWAVVAPGGSTKHHNHQEGETFFIARGQGVMSVDDDSVEVRSGDVVFQRPFQKHTLTNTSDSEDLLFLTVWWEDKDLWAGEGEAAEAAEAAGEETAPAAAEEAPRRVMVTAAPPTPNGDLHLGHLAGPYLAADVLTRYLRLRGAEAYYACGSDDNSVYVKAKGEQLGVDGDEAARRFVESIEETFALAAVDMEVFVHPNESPHHAPLVQELFKRLYEAGKLEAREVESPYCEACSQYLFEPYVSGGCPHCGAAVVGNTCEDCGRINDCIDLVEPTCTRCGSPASRLTTTRLFFPLSRYGDMLREYWRSTAMRPHLRAFCEKLLADGLPDVAVTHPTDWGIPVPVPGFEDQRIYVWLEMAPRYFAYGRHVAEKVGAEGDWQRFWCDPAAEVVQCFGFDNSFYYAAFIPALYKAFDPDIKLPVAFVTNEFYQLDGKKFSTSRGHAIWAREILQRVPADVVRFYVAATSPETEGTNFTARDFADTVRRELVEGWQGWLGQLGAKVAEEAEGVVPATGDWTAEHEHFYRTLQGLVADAAAAYEPATFSPQRAARTLSELVRIARRFGKAEDHWRGVPDRGEERRTGIALELMAAKLLAILAAPILPGFAARLWSDLGFEEPLGAGVWETRPDWVPGGQKVAGLGGPYFEPVNAEAVEAAQGRATPVLAE